MLVSRGRSIMLVLRETGIVKVKLKLKSEWGLDRIEVGLRKI